MVDCFTWNVIELFTRHINPVFAATVLEEGDVIQWALDAGFPTVLGATTAQGDAEHCRARFLYDHRVHVYDGDEIILFDVIKEVNANITFCLDARSEPAPALIHELSTIRHHRLKSHTILIRHTEILGTDACSGLTEYQVEQMIRSINHLYRFEELHDQTVLVAVFP